MIMRKNYYSRALINRKEVYGELSCTIGCERDITITFSPEEYGDRWMRLTLEDIRLLSQKTVTFQHNVNGVHSIAVDCNISGEAVNIGDDVFEVKLTMIR
jgi:hypothetical protein